MNIKEWTKGFSLNVLNKIKGHIETAVASFIITVGSVLCVIFWKWATSKHSIEFFGWIWVLLCVWGLLLVVYFIWGIVEKFGRLKNPGDVVGAIEDWFAENEIGDMPQTNTQYFFSGVEKSLNLKRGSSKIYLPLVAFKHGYAFQMGEKTFTLIKLTSQNDPVIIFERYLKPLETSEKEVLLSCNNIDSELGWPKGSAKYFLLNERVSNANFAIEIKDMGGNKLRIIRKE
jgi:hypothetical protein